MDVGPFEMEITVRENETPLDAYRRAMVQLNRIADEEYAAKLPAFLGRVREAEKNL
jgi:hypothetical protein